jgi:hypothetical protein
MGREEYRKYSEMFDVERWYAPLSDLTPRTAFVPLSKECARGLVADYKNRWNIGQPPDRDGAPYKEAVADLATQINDVLVRMSSPAFARLSSRSPKDAGLCEQPLPQAIPAMVGAISEAGGLPLAPNELLNAAFKACGKVMQVTSAQEVFSLFRHSERTFTDMSRALDDTETTWNMSVILREWHTMEMKGVILLF